MRALLFDGWASLFRVAASSAAIYVIVVVALRVVGARALAKMSAYDLVVTISLGSLVAATPITAGLSLADGAAAVLTFLLLQELTRQLQARSLRVHHLVRERPYLVLWDGEMLEDRMRQIAVSADEVRAAVRRAGMYSLADAQAVVLENDGEWSVMQRSDRTDLSALQGLDIPDRLPSGASPDRWRAEASASSERDGRRPEHGPSPSTAASPV